jgi:hypothetical protein
MPTEAIGKKILFHNTMPTNSSILSRLQIAELHPEKQEEILKRLQSIIHKRIAIKVSERLLDQDTENREGNEEVLEMIKAKIPDFDELVASTSAETIDEFADSIKRAPITT